MPRNLAIILTAIALVGAFFAFSMSITASGTNIANLSLMSARQNILIVAAACALAGMILFTTGGKSKLDNKTEESVTTGIQSPSILLCAANSRIFAATRSTGARSRSALITI